MRQAAFLSKNSGNGTRVFYTCWLHMVISIIVSVDGLQIQCDYDYKQGSYKVRNQGMNKQQ